MRKLTTSITEQDPTSGKNGENEEVLAEKIITRISSLKEKIETYEKTSKKRYREEMTESVLEKIEEQITCIDLKLTLANRFREPVLDFLPSEHGLEYISARWFRSEEIKFRFYPWILGECKLNISILNNDRTEGHLQNVENNLGTFFKWLSSQDTKDLKGVQTDLGLIMKTLDHLTDRITSAMRIRDESRQALRRLQDFCNGSFKHVSLQELFQQMRNSFKVMSERIQGMRELLKGNKMNALDNSARNSTDADSEEAYLMKEGDIHRRVTNKNEMNEQLKRKNHALVVLSDLENKYRGISKEIHFGVYTKCKKGEKLNKYIILGYDESIPFRKQLHFNEQGVEVLIKHPFDISDEASRFRHLNACNDDATEQRLDRKSIDLIYECIQQNSSYLWQKHSNLTIITGDYLKSVEGKPEKSICIVFYCLSKGYIPQNEIEFPKALSCHLGFLPTDVREGYFVPGLTELYGGRDAYNDPLCMGSNIGTEERSMERSSETGRSKHEENNEGSMNEEKRNVSGTLGLFVDLNNNRKAFITCAHVLFDCIGSNTFEYEKRPGQREYDVAQPSTGIWSGQQDRLCGVVTKAVFNPNTSPVSVDAAFVEITKRIPYSGHFVIQDDQQVREMGYTMRNLPAFESGNVRRRIYDVDIEKILIKSGSTTGLTRSLFRLDGAEVRIFADGCWMSQESTDMIVMKGQYEVETHPSLKSFFEPGDSGSAVFIKDTTPDGTQLACVGMGIGLTSYKTTIVTPIGPILDNLKLKDSEVTKFS